jgi:pyruvate/2-oxoglutarate dehydrogenase complex dihydrolipoamide acyltransferase (E2) component
LSTALKGASPFEEAYMYVYRNLNTGGEVTLPKLRPTFEESEDWERIEGEPPEAISPANQPGGPTVDPAALANDELIVLYLGCAAELKEREGSLDDDLFEAYREQIEAVFGEVEEETEPAAADDEGGSGADPNNEVAGQTEVEATASAVKLANEMDVDLRTVTGTGDEGRIVLDDVRKAVAAKG